MNFLQFHAIAAARGDGLRPELKGLFEKLAVSSFETDMARSEAEDRAEPLREVVRPIRFASASKRGIERRNSQAET